MIKIFLLLLIQFFLLHNYSSAQDMPVEWGEIPRADLEMKSFPADTNASALILCDYGEAKFNNDLNIEFRALLRVKIFSAKGYDQATKSITIYTDDDAESIYDIEGITYSLDENGEVTETELDDDEIYEEEINDDYTSYKFTMPALKPGCIFEIRYKIVSRYLHLMKDWTFQDSEPVRWSEYKITAPRNIIYSAVKRGFEPFAVDEVSYVNNVFSSPASGMIGKTITECYQYRWAVKDAPAIRDEPFITTTSDYTNKVEVQLSAYTFVNVPPKKVLEDWPKLIEELIDDKNFGDRIDVSGEVEDLEEKITAGLTTPEEKMKAIYNWVAASIVSSGNRFMADQEPDDVIEYKKGSSADVTFLLLSLLKSAGITGYPVIASTRGNGRVQDLYPIYSQFNYVLAKVNIGTKSYFLDATDPYRPYNLLSLKILNVKGLVIKEGKPEWVNFNSENKNSNISLVVADINEEGVIKARFEEQYTDYKALKYRSKLTSKKDDEIAEEIFDTDEYGFEVDSVMILNKDSIEAPLNIKAWITSDSYVQKNGDMIYVNPCMINRLTENPFKTAVRKYPVDYGYKSSSTIMFNITIPEGYEVKELLQDKIVKVNNELSFSRRSQVEGNKIQVMNKLEIKASEIKPSYYDQLKRFYAQVIAIQAEQIVLSIKEEPLIIEERGRE